MCPPVEFSSAAQEQISDLYTWIAEQSGSPLRAQAYTNAIIDFCDSLRPFPRIGIARDDIRPGLRTLGFRRRVVIAFTTDNDAVTILGIFYGGQNFEHQLS